MTVSECTSNETWPLSIDVYLHVSSCHPLEYDNTESGSKIEENNDLNSVQDTKTESTPKIENANGFNSFDDSGTESPSKIEYENGPNSYQDTKSESTNSKIDNENEFYSLLSKIGYFEPKEKKNNRVFSLEFKYQVIQEAKKKKLNNRKAGKKHASKKYD